ncbi:hypothetical protein QE422_002919 [Chryseobacterium sp. SORGH_AS 447]|uniref:hypothetical protein n=1 Tax=Chryseobacterium sp. SORGH_AS_0447 TaxID=3041769 RepID=UPI0027836FA4|nr:hypothetical protein [Chryseobacterium sp. SORGH_AS_0447]MDQ1162551.1 hypothetical protein [Chryseobacterium sp. SORGH_AS_0447]
MKIITILSTTFILLNCKKTETKKDMQSTDFKIGKFQLINKNSNRKYLLQRTADFQIEQTFDLDTGKKLKKDRYYKIFWKDDNQYTLILDTTKSQYNEIDLYVNSVGGYKCTINDIEDNCSIVETSVKGEGSVTSEICKIR